MVRHGDGTLCALYRMDTARGSRRPTTPSGSPEHSVLRVWAATSALRGKVRQLCAEIAAGLALALTLQLLHDGYRYAVKIAANDRQDDRIEFRIGGYGLIVSLGAARIFVRWSLL